MLANEIQCAFNFASEETSMTDYPHITLKAKEEHRIRSGHLWVYSNEIDTSKTPLKDFASGQLVEIRTANGQFLGYAYLNPNTLLCARILSKDKQHGVTRQTLKKRLQNALQLRSSLFPDPYYRLVHGEGDYLPGLVIDRYGDYLVCQFNTAGMEMLKPDLIDLLCQLLNPKGILVRSDLNQRNLEGLTDDHGVLFGEIPEQTEVKTAIGNYIIPLRDGQKTGWFYDQTENRQQISTLAKDKSALDLFCYVGSWGIGAAIAGAKSVLCVDASETALEYVKLNAAHNHVADRVSTLKGDANAIAKQLSDEQQRFDLIMVDPPAYMKRKKDAKNGLEAYRRTNELALRLTQHNSFLFSSSCSFHMPLEQLKKVIYQAARHVDRQLQLLYQGQQDKDHPVHPAMPETQYLKHLMYHVNIG